MASTFLEVRLLVRQLAYGSVPTNESVRFALPYSLVALVGLTLMSSFVSAQSNEWSRVCDRPARAFQQQTRDEVFACYDYADPKNIDKVTATQLQQCIALHNRLAAVVQKRVDCLRRYGWNEGNLGPFKRMVENEQGAASDAAKQLSRLNASNQPSAQASTGNNPAGTGSASSGTCPSTLAHLAPRLPNYRDSVLQQARSVVLNTNLPNTLAEARRQGYSDQAALSALLQQADVAEQGLPNAESCLRSISGATGDVARQLRDGSYPLRDDGSIASNCARGYVMAYWQALANREIAVAFACLIQR